MINVRDALSSNFIIFRQSLNNFLNFHLVEFIYTFLRIFTIKGGFSGILKRLIWGIILTLVCFISRCILLEYGGMFGILKFTTLRLRGEMIRTLEEIAKMFGREKSDIMREALQIGIREMKI